MIALLIGKPVVTMDTFCLREVKVAWQQDGKKQGKRRTLLEKILCSGLEWDREKKGSQNLGYMGVKQ
jgi:hypothetical protein